MVHIFMCNNWLNGKRVYHSAPVSISHLLHVLADTRGTEPKPRINVLKKQSTLLLLISVFSCQTIIRLYGDNFNTRLELFQSISFQIAWKYRWKLTFLWDRRFVVFPRFCFICETFLFHSCLCSVHLSDSIFNSQLHSWCMETDGMV